MMINLKMPNESLNWILRAEGGYVNDPQDPGGKTNKGITQNTLNQAVKMGLVKTRDVKDLTNEDVRAIYQYRYWQPSMCCDLPYALAMIHFDCAVNCGVKQAAKLLQRSINKVSTARKVMVSGVMCKELCDVARGINEHTINTAYLDTRLDFYKSLPTFHHFGKGWVNRLMNLAKYLNLEWRPKSN